MNSRGSLSLRYLSLVFILVTSSLLSTVYPARATAPKVNLTPSPITIIEGNSQQISIHLDEPIVASDLNPAYVDVNLTSSNPSRLSVDTPTVSYAGNEWSQIKTFNISATDDALQNGNQTIVLSFITVSNSEYYNQFTGSVTVNLKDNEVAITSPTVDQSVYAGPLTIMGTGPAGYSVDVMVDGDIVGTAVVDQTGAFSLIISAVSAGNHTFSAQKKQLRQYAYMANRSTGAIDVVDVVSKAYVHEILGPDVYYAAIFNARDNRMYAASEWFNPNSNTGSCALKIFNATTFAVEDSISASGSGSYPISLTLDSAGNKLYEVCHDPNVGYIVIVYDTNTYAPTGSFNLGLEPGDYPSGIAIDPTNTKIWVRYNRGIKTFNVSDLNNAQNVELNPSGNAVNNIVFTEDGSKAYTAESDTNDVYAINASDLSLTSSQINSNLSNLAFTPNFSKLYAISSITSSIYVLDPSTLGVLDQQSTAQPPESLAITDDGLNFVVGDDHGSGEIYFGSTSGDANVTHTITAPNGGSYFTSTGNFIGPSRFVVLGAATSISVSVKSVVGVPNTGFSKR